MRKSSGSYGEKLGYRLKNNLSSLVKKNLSSSNQNAPAVTSQNAYDAIAERELNGDSHQPY